MTDLERVTLPAKPAARYLGISYWKLLELVRVGKIPHIRVGGRILFRKEGLDRWLEEQEAASIRKEEPLSGRIRRLK